MVQMERRGEVVAVAINRRHTHTFSECWSANARATDNTAATNTAAAVNNKFSGEALPLRFSQKNSGQAVQSSSVDPGAEHICQSEPQMIYTLSLQLLFLLSLSTSLSVAD